MSTCELSDDLLPLTEDWLKAVGFKWHQFDRQPDKHWLLWLGDSAAQGRIGACEDIGIEVAPGRSSGWFCWFRSDAAHRYHRFIHVRQIDARRQLIALIEAITGQQWCPENHFYGSVLTPERAVMARKRDEDLDRRLMREGHPWSSVERDDTRGRALPEHLEEHAKARGDKA